ncbi:MAG: hypothetical protein CVU12_02020 [Bacteroidetes bacterium HGW-Bacteroidetes-7]|jgi:hypothetical protein|nr:MAG: hypothetical protein CVU12_02020 [Bacteroidetes bacterium HGW-Bacteroidetes-7]
MAKTFVLSDESINSYGFWVVTSGIDLSQFKRNPLVLWMHSRPWRGTKDEVLPIGSIENLRVEDKKLLGDVVFDETDTFAKAISSKVDGGFLRMGSISFEPIETSKDTKWLKPGQTRETVVKCRLIEFSIVDIGSNNNSLALCADPIVCDAEQKPVFLASGNESPIKLLNEILKPNNNLKMEQIALKVGLPANATEKEICDQIDIHLEKASRAESLSKKISDIETKQKEAMKTEATSLVEAAILSGKIDAKAKESFLSLFDKDFENAKVTLAAMPDRPDFKNVLGKERGEGSELEKLSWEELDKRNLLGKLKRSYPDLYKDKFKAQFNTEPNM